MMRNIFGVLFVLSLLALPIGASALQLNEIRIYQSPDIGSDKYFELAGDIGEDMSGYQYVVLTGGGMVITEFPLFGQLEDGFFAATIWDVDPFGYTQVCTGYDYYVQAPMSQPGGLWFPTSGNQTYMIVLMSEDFQNRPYWGMDLDTDDDGTLDVTPWEQIIDSVAVVESIATGGNIYSDSIVGPAPGNVVPCHVIKCDGQWFIGQDEVCSDDTIGSANCVPGPSGVPARESLPYALHEAYPNPFNPQTTISFDLPQRARASLRVYAVTGDLVRTLLNDGMARQGRNEFVWDGRDDAGRRISSGVYFYSLQVGEFAATRRMVLLK